MEKLKRYSISLLIAFVIAAIFLLISSVIFAYTNINDRHLNSFVLGSVMISVIIGSMILLKKIKEKGFLYGLIFGLIYFLIIYVKSEYSCGNMGTISYDSKSSSSL